MAAPLAQEEWTGRDVRLSEVERALCNLREQAAHETDGPDLRTSVLNHMAWVPAEWQEAALETLAGLAERHPSRTILLFPEPDAEDGIDARAAVLAFPLSGSRRHVAAEVLELRLKGRRAAVPASVVTPLLVSDLPVFVRWRGCPPFGAVELEQLVDLADRLVVDSGEWSDLPGSYAELTSYFDRIAVSDIAWRRTLGVRRAIAERWPEVAETEELRVASPAAEAYLLAGWLRSRLERELRLVHDDAETLELVALDGDVVTSRSDDESPSDLLSAELDELARDRVYEEAVNGVARRRR